MGRAAISERKVCRAEDDAMRVEVDRLAVEAPLEIRVRGEPAMVIMRTPGEDEELVTGYLIGEGLAGDAKAIGRLVSAPGDACEYAGDAIGGDSIDLPDAELARDLGASRAAYSSASCGACGKATLGELALRAAPLRAALAVKQQVIAALPDRLRAAQVAFAQTGGIHAAGAFSPSGALLAAREDIGRHNAVDKLVGWAAREGRLPMNDAILCVSGRLSFEIVQKAIVAGFPIVAAVSAPSSLAVDLAERYRVALCGFVRQGRFNVYAHPSRIV